MHWSPSGLQEFETCPALYYRRRVLRLKETKSAALERGILVHEILEAHVKDDKPLPKEFERWIEPLAEVKKHSPTPEQNWTIDADWKLVPKGQQWGWLKTDLHFVLSQKKFLCIIDYKTGGIYTDKHRDQFLSYAVAGAMLYPEVAKVRTEGWYIDHGEIRDDEYEAKKLRQRARREIESRVKKFLVAAADPDTEHDERPGTACRYCPFHPKKGGPCKAAR
jgi:RecB family exonuclease